MLGNYTPLSRYLPAPQCCAGRGGEDVTAPHWPAVIERLERRYTHMDIAVEVGRSEGWVGQLKRELISEPLYSVGVRLLSMAAALDAENCVPRETTEN